jgi:hypothetical protein
MMESHEPQLQEALAAFEEYMLYDAGNRAQQLLIMEGYIERHCMPTALAWPEHREEFLMHTGKLAPAPPASLLAIGFLIK